MAASLAGVTADALPKEALDGDKVMLVQVSAAAGGYQVAAREFDVATGLWSARGRPAGPPAREAPRPALAAIFEAFAPLARVSAVERPPGDVAAEGVGA